MMDDRDSQPPSDETPPVTVPRPPTMRERASSMPPSLDAVPLFFSILCEVDATEFFEDEGPDYLFCVEQTRFDSADGREFIIPIGADGRDSSAYKEMRAKMDEYICSPRFIQVYEQAAAAGAHRVLFYAD